MADKFADERIKIVRMCSWSGHADYADCDLCGEKVTADNLSGWDEDGHAYCTAHGPLAKGYRKGIPQMTQPPDTTLAARLLPCPFCGSVKVGVGSSEGLDDEVDVHFSVMCSGCGASVSLYIDTEAEAVTAWNTRAPAAHTAAVQAAVAKAVEACAVICEDQAKLFASPEYATGQPMSSLSERIACNLIAAAIRARKGDAL